MTERDTFLAIHQREFQTTRRLINAYPSNKLSYRPHERSRSAAELASTLANEEMLFVQATKGIFNPAEVFAINPPASVDEVVRSLETNVEQVEKAVSSATEADLNSLMDFPSGKMRRMDVAWAILFDLIHHRGQFSVYVRMAGGKVPSIYGPSADEPNVHAVSTAKA